MRWDARRMAALAGVLGAAVIGAGALAGATAPLAGRVDVTVTLGGRPFSESQRMAVVLNNSAGAPAWNNYGQETYTDAEGRYAVEARTSRVDVHLGEWPVNGERFASQVVYGVAPPASLAFELDQPTGSLSGVALDRNGRPASGVKVEAFNTDYCGEAAPFGWGTTDPGRTGADGAFRLPRLLPGLAYNVYAHGPGFSWTVYAVSVRAGQETGGVELSGRTNEAELAPACSGRAPAPPAPAAPTAAPARTPRTTAAPRPRPAPTTTEAAPEPPEPAPPPPPSPEPAPDADGPDLPTTAPAATEVPTTVATTEAASPAMAPEQATTSSSAPLQGQSATGAGRAAALTGAAVAALGGAAMVVRVRRRSP
ncbi:MAG: carboxypeptidase-like regulatory domain-containing protein [Acidimicrobiales bacterium]